MKSILQRIMLSSAFVVGLAIPLASTWTSSAQALADCSLLSGHDSWTHTIPGGGTFTVSVDYATGVTVTGTPPPFASLPLVLTSSSGHVLTITAVAAPTGLMRQYAGDFTAEAPEVCNCSNISCGNTHDCTEFTKGMNCTKSEGCTSVTCGGVGGSCTGGVCQAAHSFSARF